MKTSSLLVLSAAGLLLTSCQSTPPAATASAPKKGGNRDDFIRAMQHDIDAGKYPGMTKMSVRTQDGSTHNFKTR